MPNLKNIQMGKWHLKNNPLLSHRKRVVKRYPNNRWAFRSQDSKAQASGRSRTSISAPFNDRLLFAFRLTRRDKYVKNYFCKFRINQSKFTYGEKKKKRPNFYGMFSQSLPMSAAFTAILKMKLPQCNAHRPLLRYSCDAAMKMQSKCSWGKAEVLSHVPYDNLSCW